VQRVVAQRMFSTMIATAISGTSYPVRFGEGLSHLAQRTPKVFVSWRVPGLKVVDRCRSQSDPACGNRAPEMDWCHISWHGECPQPRSPWPSPHQPRSSHAVRAVLA